MEVQTKKAKETNYWNEELRKVKCHEKFIWDYCEETAYKKETYSALIDERYGFRLSNMCKNNNLMIYIFLLSTLKITLSKYMMKNNILIGIPNYNAKDKNKASLNKVLPLIYYVNYERTYLEYMNSIKGKILECYKNQGYLNSKILLEKNLSNDVMDVTPITISLKGLHQDRDIDYICNSSKNELSFLLEQMDDKSLKVDIVYNSNKITKNTVKALCESYIVIFKDVLINYNKKIKDIKILSEKDINKILYEFNDTVVDYQADKTIQELFEEQVKRTPDSIAVVFQDNKLTYKELNQKANSVARVLRAKGVKADSIIGIMVERSIEMMIGIMGILKSGGAYLPIDPKYPKERVEYILSDSKSELLLTKNTLVEGMTFDGTIIDLFNEDLFNESPKNLKKINNSTNLAYVIYTSGTTGRPKGAMIEHKSLVNRLNWMQKKYPLTKDDAILQKTTYTFDVSVWEILWWSLVGARVCMLNPNDEKDPKKIIEAIDKYDITTIHFVPSMLDMFLYCLEEYKDNSKLLSLRQVFSSGEALNLKQVSKFYKEFQSGKKLINLYGPTEATIDVSYFECNSNDNSVIIPIGKPIDNTKLYILKNNMIAPIGVTGELYIAGDGLARGYLNRPDLTDEKFVNNPFEIETKMYKTGDLARWMPDGNIEFLGRIDNQVKIRGFRIELGEIENRLLQHEMVEEVAVIVKENKEKEKYICAYVVSESHLDEIELKSYLKEVVPEYMIPTYFIKIEKMPLTLNGKLDRRALPEPSFDGVLNQYEAPENKLQEALVDIWSNVLGIKKIGINDNFFAIGGHSLKATVLMSKVHKELNKEIQLKELFKAPTIKQLSELIESKEENMHSKIKRIEEKQFYEASSAQKRMFMIQQFDKDSIVYNMPQVFELEGKVDKNKIEETFRNLTERHDALRTYFQTFNGEIIQRIQKNYEFKLEHRGEQGNIEDIINAFVRPFNLEKAPLFRVELVEKQEKTYLLIDMHHIISDGVSMGILIKDFTELYSGKSLEPLKLQYKDFAAWQNNFLKSEQMKKQEEYWVNRFIDEIPVLSMPIDYERPISQSFEGDSVSFEINEEGTSKLRKLTKETGTTMHMALLSAFTILLSKYSGQEDIVVGTPIAGRPHVDLENMMGMFVNTLPLRNMPKGHKKYIDFLNEVKENSLNAYENQSYQIEMLIDKLDIRRDTGRNPLFDVMFNMMSTINDEKINLGDMVLNKYNNDNKIAKFDLTLNVLEKQNILSFSINYCSKLFKKETIERLSHHYKSLLYNIVNNHQIKICEIDMMSKNEKNEVIYAFNNTNSEYPKAKTINELFEEQVEKTPYNTAVVYKNEKLTYTELNERANALARTLREKGVSTESVVAVLTDKSMEMMVGIMAILKAGAAYLPIDPQYPEDRIKYMLEDSKVNILLSQNKFINFMDYDLEVMDLQDDEIYKNQKHNLDRLNSSDNLAYIIYTSGSTGAPKGVLIEHRGVVRLIKNTNYISIDKEDVILQLSNYAFDGSIFDIYGSLLNGAKLVLIDKKDSIDINKLGHVIVNEKVSIFFVTTALFNTIVDTNIHYLKNVRKILFGGERISVKHAKRALEYLGKGHLVHVYGPTEGTVYTTYHFIDDIEENSDNIPIGKSISNSTAYVIGHHMQLVPIGVAGELYIGGDGLARGYLNRKELTAEKFVDNPFKVGTKIYKTGDLVRWLPNGSIEFLGRIDNQVKIRGFRIELGEIENKLLQHQYIKEAVVLVKLNNEKEKYICAYLVNEKDVSGVELKRYLKESLPEYMIPEHFIRLDKIPLTTNGKINKRALPEPNLEIMLNKFEAPRNEVEEKLCEIWSELFGASQVGINDNFFELGGHSLKAMVLISKIHKEMNKEVELKELFKCPTVKELSEFIETKGENIYSKIEVLEERNYYESSSAQKRMYMLQQLEKSSTAYNMPMIFEMEGNVDRQRIEQTFKTLVMRHEALRTYFETIEEKIVQKIDNSYEFKLVEKIDNNDIEAIVSRFLRPFNLERGPLFRIEIVDNKDKTYLLIDMHHIISDGVSMTILMKEFKDLYDGQHLQSLKLQYKDFTAWQNKILNSESLKTQEDFWINSLNGEIPVLNLQYDYERPRLQSFEGDSLSFELDSKTSEELKKLMKQTGVTAHMILLSAFAILLSKYSEQEDILIGTPVAGRPHADLQNIMGMFVNTLVLRNKPEGNKSYIEFLKEVKDNALLAYQNQTYQFERLVEKLDIRRDSSRNPLFDVMFNMIDTVTTKDIKLEKLLLKEYDSGNKVSKFDLTLNALEQNNIFKFNIEYCTKLFNRETIERISTSYVRILNNIINNVDTKICDIELMNEIEKNQILYDFNNTKAGFPNNKTINELFEEQVERTPDRIAIICDNAKLTYRELNEKSNQLARVLRRKGVKADSIVGIIAERSLEMVIGITGILKAGGAYLPIDYKFPKDRIKYILDDSHTNIILIGTDKIDEKELNYNGSSINLKDIESYDLDKSNLDKNNCENNLAYVIYTSGSTGNPKGVLIQHNSLVNRIMWMDKNYPINENDTILQKTTYTFDVSVWELIWAGLVGAKLAMLKPEGEKDVKEIVMAIEKYKITTMHFVPSMLDIFIEYVANNECNLKSLRQVFSSGEALKGNQVSKFYKIVGNKSSCKLINLYGPTEAAIDVTYYNCCEADNNKVPIGKPIDNISLYIVGRNNDLKPIGLQGELCIGGVGVARGYLNNDMLTKSKFVENPFEKGKIMYKTGDIAKWNSDGNIECLGRIDNQVKIRGFRIELGEIEKILLKNQEVREAVVIDRENSDGYKYLCAYIVSNKPQNISILRSMLSKDLPDYMIPAQFVELQYIPLANNGKIDRKLLTKIEGNMIMESEFEMPSNEIEENLTKVWQDVLEIKQVGVNNKFLELGGDSIKAIQIVSRIKKYGYVLDVKELLSNLNIKEISKLIKISYLCENEGVVEGTVGLTPIQEWFFNNNFVDEHHWNQSITIFKKDGFKEEVLSRAFRELIVHHDSLRIVFKKRNGKILQTNNGIDNINVDIEVCNLVNSMDINKAMNYIGDKLQKSIYLENGPLIKLALFKTVQGDYLSIIIHHLIIDGVSWRILLEDLDEAYRQMDNNEDVRLLGKTTSYKKWSESIAEYASSKELLNEIDYWSSMENKSIKVIPKDNICTDNKLKNTKTISFELSERETKDLIMDINNAYMTVANDILLTAVALSIKEWANIENILIELEGHGREEIAENIDITRTIGWFTSKYPVVLNMDRSYDIAYSIKSVKETLRHIPAKGIGYGILKWLGEEKVRNKLKFNLEPEICFNYLGQLDKDSKNKLFQVADKTIGENISLNNQNLHALTITCIIIEDRMRVYIQYNNYEFSEKNILNLCNILKEKLLIIINHCKSKDEIELTPTDLGDDNLELEELDYIADIIESNMDDFE